MNRLTRMLWNDEAGFVMSGELVLIGTVLTLAMIVGLAELAGAVNNEMSDMAGAVDGMNQGYDQPAGDTADFDQTGT